MRNIVRALAAMLSFMALAATSEGQINPPPNALVRIATLSPAGSGSGSGVCIAGVSENGRRAIVQCAASTGRPLQMLRLWAFQPAAGGGSFHDASVTGPGPWQFELENAPSFVTRSFSTGNLFIEGISDAGLPEVAGSFSNGNQTWWRVALRGEGAEAGVVGRCSIALADDAASWSGSDIRALTVSCSHSGGSADGRHLHETPGDNILVDFTGAPEVRDPTQPGMVESLFLARLTPAAAESVRNGHWRIDMESMGIGGQPACGHLGNLVCLGGRFRVETTWRNEHGQGGAGRPSLLTPDIALVAFSRDTWDLLVRIVDGCATNGHHWVVGGGLTNMEATVTVTDMQTGQVKTYSNPSNAPFQSIRDTTAFASCP